MKPLRRIISLFPILFLPVSVPAQAPELSADAPISYSEDKGLLIASGNAVFIDENTRLEAHEIRYDRNRKQVEASGNVRVTREGLRLVSEHVTYNATTKVVTAGRFRAGYPPLFMEGEAFTGTLDQLDFSKVTLYYREPVTLSPRLAVESGTWVRDQSISGRGLRLKAVGNLGLPLPAFEHALDAPSADASASIGFRNRLGAYAQTRWLYPFNRQFSAGGNLDLFSKRGVLVGPAFAWRPGSANLVLDFDSGWIHDHAFGERGFDIFGERIEQDRGFAGVGLRAASDDNRLQLQARTTYLSDSEVLRDFRADEYFRRFQPDHFADFTWQQDNLLVNVFGRAQLNDSYRMVERLPEVRAEWLPTELGKTGIHLQAAASALRYRLQEVVPANLSVLFPANPLGLPGQAFSPGPLPSDLIASPFHDRLDGVATLTRPFHGPRGVDLVLRAGGRWSQYHRGEDGPTPSLTEDRWVGELGFDLSQTLARTYAVDRPKWDMERLRHVSRLQLQYRWHPGAGDMPGVIPPFDRYGYHARRPVLDLADLAHLDGLAEWSVARFGWENLLEVAAKDQPYRELLLLGLYQDLDFSAESGADEWDALYAEADFKPFPWLSLQLREKFSPEETETEATYFSATVHSADLWALRLQSEYLQGAIEQYELAGWYRVSEDLGLTASWMYDSKLETFTRQQYGFTRRFANVWELQFYVAFNDQNDREDDFSVGLRVQWLSF